MRSSIKKSKLHVVLPITHFTAIVLMWDLCYVIHFLLIKKCNLMSFLQQPIVLHLGVLKIYADQIFQKEVRGREPNLKNFTLICDLFFPSVKHAKCYYISLRHIFHYDAMCNFLKICSKPTLKFLKDPQL